MSTFNVYCDESCHLQTDKSDIMVLGAVWVNVDKKQEINNRINKIKERHKVSKFLELKWTKLSPALYECYEDLINYFFDCDDLHFRGLIVDNKNKFSNKYGSYDEWYYKMYFQMLDWIISPDDIFNIYIDIKDTRSKYRIKKLHEVLSNNNYDFDHKCIQCIQPIRSDEVAIMQLVDLLIGALSYNARKITTSNSKQKIIELIKERSGYSLERNTLLKEEKFNLLHLQLLER